MKKVREMYSRDSEFQRFETLKRNREKRAKQGLFFLEGVHPVEQAVANGYEFYAIGVDAEKRLSGWAEDMLRRANPEMIFRMHGSLHSELSDREESCELVCLARQRLGIPRFEKDPLARDVVFDRPAADFYDPQCIRASIGTVFNKPHVNLEGCDAALEYLRALPEKPLIVGTSAHGDALLTEVDLTGPVAMVIGNETFGMSKAWREKCDVVAKIPIYGGASSLNAGSAATVCFYEVARQREFKHT